MPAPENAAAMQSWLHALQLFQFDFGWKDLENAVYRHGIQAVDAVLPAFNPEHRLYHVMHKTAVELLINAGKFESALASLEQLDTDTREECVEEEWAVEVGLRRFDRAKSLLKTQRTHDIPEWKKIGWHAWKV